MADDKNYYQGTFDRMEPDVAAIDTAAVWASIAISLKRIADALEKANEVVNVRGVPEGQTFEITPKMIDAGADAAADLYGALPERIAVAVLEAALKMGIKPDKPTAAKFCNDCIWWKMTYSVPACIKAPIALGPDPITGVQYEHQTAWQMRSPSGECGPDGKLWVSK